MQIKSYLKQFISNRYEWVPVALVLVVMSCYYLSHLTVSGLWYDEGIEYFYSKYMVGSLPIGGYWENMYRRVCFTMQPPLYNILMYFWLLLFDTELGFRLAGVLTTFIGAIGLYCCLRKATGRNWAVAGLFVYLSMGSVVYYALECAEYNLLLCMECWMLYFFIGCISAEKQRVRRKAIIGFYAFATLAIYSQYGAAFLIMALFVTLLCVYIRRRDAASIKWLLGIGMITLLFAIVPLWFLFISKQMALQGSSTVDHSAVYVNNLFYSIFVSFANNISWLFNLESIEEGGMTAIINFVILLSVLCTLLAAFVKKSSSIFKTCVVASIISWGAFFIASAHSFYAYNGYIDKLGCENIIEGNRYVLFFAPLFLATVLIGVYYLCIKLGVNECSQKVALSIALFFASVFYVRMWMQDVNIKDDVRESTFTWIKSGGYKYHTLVQEWAAGAFYFYFSHSPVFNKETADRIIMTYMEVRANSTEKMSAYLESLGTFSHSELYYVGNRTAPGSPNNLQVITETFRQRGYSIETIGEEKNSVVLHLVKARRK